MVSVPDFPRPVPQIGWLGVTAIATWIALAIANWRIAILVCGTFVSFGLLGFWSDSIDLLLLTGVSVLIAAAIGMPLAVLYGTNPRARGVMTTFLDLMQTMPTFVYLLPVVLFFGIGVSGAIVCTLIYALPPLIRIGGYGISAVSPTTIEATDSAGQTSWQRLMKVQIPMARKTIIVGLNQTTMAALSMAIIASYVDGPGLGKPVLRALVRNDVGGAIVPGILIVRDRDHARPCDDRRQRALRARRPRPGSQRPAAPGGARGRCDRSSSWRSGTPARASMPPTFPKSAFGGWLADRLDSLSPGWSTCSTGRPRRSRTSSPPCCSTRCRTSSPSRRGGSPPWASRPSPSILGGLRALIATLICLAGIKFFDLWHDAMITLNMTLVATLLVMVLALAFGVWMARSRRADLIMRPLLDAGQTIPRSST